jgi:hypothetical protein
MQASGDFPIPITTRIETSPSLSALGTTTSDPIATGRAGFRLGSRRLLLELAELAHCDVRAANGGALRVSADVKRDLSRLSAIDEAEQREKREPS